MAEPRQTPDRTDPEPARTAGAPEPADPAERARRTVEEALTDLAGTTEARWESPAPGRYVVTLPGTRKLSTTCSLAVGEHSLSVNAFVIRRPDENHAEVHRWLLERNTRLYGVAYALDGLGDVYLAGRLPLASVTAEEIDRVLGTVLEQADGAFNTLLEKGFAGAIRREHAWRTARGESTRNLEAFAHLTRPPAGTAGPSGPDADPGPGGSA
ncbi:YbjN domain-containing protein [Streptomyces alkaliphilus]|uniref:YbjN domain-containing protein n=1 Tax=Streptomyces alkaliphilus TaxID=1472722 RepID=A0A7W3TAG5_9ACTN|nr:YbjN domain-containing protein [Streptomyces alkaliphilus]MBB0243226.1 YbjN domain-containing protein [Streptomyces alkaliphilus]